MGRWSWVILVSPAGSHEPLETEEEGGSPGQRCDRATAEVPGAQGRGCLEQLTAGEDPAPTPPTAGAGLCPRPEGARTEILPRSSQGGRQPAHTSIWGPRCPSGPQNGNLLRWCCFELCSWSSVSAAPAGQYTRLGSPARHEDRTCPIRSFSPHRTGRRGRPRRPVPLSARTSCP